MLFQILHIYDVDGGFGDPIEKSKTVAIVDATEDQIKEFLNVWDKPRVYDRPYGALYEHHVTAVPMKIVDLRDVTPYDPATRDLPKDRSVFADEEDEYEEEEEEDRLELELEGRLTGVRYHV